MIEIPNREVADSGGSLPRSNRALAHFSNSLIVVEVCRCLDLLVHWKKNLRLVLEEGLVSLSNENLLLSFFELHRYPHYLLLSSLILHFNVVDTDGLSLIRRALVDRLSLTHKHSGVSFVLKVNLQVCQDHVLHWIPSVGLHRVTSLVGWHGLCII